MTDRRSPLQNRVDPFGQIVAAGARGAFMGNRGGCMHDERQRLGRRRWVSARWITCLLEFRGWHREVMTPRRYTELFFLDEATAFAAGHRPCAECRHGDLGRFREAWVAGNPAWGFEPRTSISAIDAVLHRERTAAHRPAPVDCAALPGGVFVTRPNAPAVALLAWGGRLHEWSFGGYRGVPQIAEGVVTVLTPATVVNAFRAGYIPLVHPTAASRPNYP